MAQVYTTGPCHMFAGVLAGKKPVYLGTAEKAPLIAEQFLYDEVFNDLGGQAAPFDSTAQGNVAQVSMVLTRFNYGVADRMASMPNFISGIPGVNLLSHYGVPMGQIGATFPFWILFPYAASANPGMPGGYRFWSCRTLHRQIMPGSTSQRMQLVLAADRAFPLRASSPVGQNAIVAHAPPIGALTYDYNVSELSNVPIN